MAKKKVIILSLFSLILLGIIFIPSYLQIRKLLRQNRGLERQIREIAQANQKLRQEQERLKNDPIYLEKVAREKLGVVRKGEVIYQVLPRPEDQ